MHAINDSVVRAKQVAIELQIVRGIGENEIDAGRWQPSQLGKTISLKDAIDRHGRTLTATLNHSDSRYSLDADATGHARLNAARRHHTRKIGVALRRQFGLRNIAETRRGAANLSRAPAVSADRAAYTVRTGT
jgi:hypothetical protein